jgi:ABC-type dipeptide/oligopeptide/nickel transport system permease subunit
MENEKKKNPNIETANDGIEASDFRFVQKDKAIHDVKFQTKPTTFLKDAITRFVKNKSSVVAGIILSVIVLMAIFVPILDTSDIESSKKPEALLSPRWYGFENASILNGTRKYSGVVVDTITDPENPTPAGYKSEAVRSMSTYEDYISSPSQYGWGGMVALRADTRDKNVAIASPAFYVYPDEDYTFTFNFNEEENAALEVSANYMISLWVSYDNNGSYTQLLLKPYSSDFGAISIDNVSQVIEENRPTSNTEAFFNVRFLLTLKTATSGTYPTLLIDSISGVNDNDETDGFFDNIGFVDGNSYMLREVTGSTQAAYKWGIASGYSGSKSLYKGLILKANFVYDQYLAVYGEQKDFQVGKSEVDVYIAKGWMSYDYDIGPSSFVRLSEHCPIIEVTSQKTSTAQGITSIYVIGKVSMYRYYGYSSMPHFIFGTDISGHDFFKRVFSGLRTSLMLGVLATVINVTIGIIWGAISAYYGGWTDLIMERLTDILGGVPWIVVMTLAILHFGNNMWTFLMAICLTGWIGTASVTRSQFYRYKRREYVLASRTLGASDRRLIFRHILPNAVGVIVTSSVLMIPSIIFSEATIAYLQLGLQGVPSLGVALSEAQNYLKDSSYMTISASIVVSILMICFNLFGNGLRDAFNPSLKGVD